jgi:hypothetical protein
MEGEGKQKNISESDLLSADDKWSFVVKQTVKAPHKM